MLKVLLLTGFSLLLALSSFNSYAQVAHSSTQNQAVIEQSPEANFAAGRHVKRMRGTPEVRIERGEEKLYLIHRTPRATYEFVLTPSTKKAKRTVERILDSVGKRFPRKILVSGYIQKPNSKAPVEILAYDVRIDFSKSGGGVDSL